MAAPARTGTLIYAKDLSRLATFYQTLLGMTIVHQSAEIVVLHAPDVHLIVHQIPPHIAATFEIASPPALRDDAALKPFFSVSSFADAHAVAAPLGGGVFGPSYDGPGFRITNAHDPEGNIIQLREPMR